VLIWAPLASSGVCASEGQLVDQLNLKETDMDATMRTVGLAKNVF